MRASLWDGNKGGCLSVRSSSRVKEREEETDFWSHPAPVMLYTCPHFRNHVKKCCSGFMRKYHTPDTTENYSRAPVGMREEKFPAQQQR